MIRARVSLRVVALLGAGLMAASLAGCGNGTPPVIPQAGEKQSNARQDNAKANPGPGGIPPKNAARR